MEQVRVLREAVRGAALIACAAGLLLGLAPHAHARVTRIVFGAPTYPYGTALFGSVGQYEQLDGVAYGEIDPVQIDLRQCLMNQAHISPGCRLWR